MRGHRFILQEAVTKAASYSLDPLDHSLGRYTELVVRLNVTSVEDGSLDETFDLYITTANEAGAKWDLIHFPQLTVDGAYSFVARLHSDLVPQQVTTAGPGVPAVESGTLAVATGQTNAIKSLADGRIRHGPWGERIGYELVVAGTVATGVSYSIAVEAR